jgi:pimeloyl-ACP methyl ester carboxylesterase
MITEGYADVRGHRLWYRASMPAVQAAPPLLLVHGGPGGSSDVFEPVEAIASDTRAVVCFDQLGSGRSDRPRSIDLWGMESCVEQIASVRQVLGLDRIHLLGHSWGGTVALEYVLTRSLGVESLILSSPVISVRRWNEHALRLRSEMPRHIAAALERCERSFAPRRPPPVGSIPAPSLSSAVIDARARRMRAAFPMVSHPLAARVAAWLSYLPPMRRAAYEILGIQFVLRHVCRCRPMPPGMFRMLAGMNKEIYEVLWGPSEFCANGLLRDCDFTPRLSAIHVPTLVLSGRHDEAAPEEMALVREAIPGARQVVLEGSSHCGMWEEPQAYRAAIADFLADVESRRGPQDPRRA